MPDKLAELKAEIAKERKELENRLGDDARRARKRVDAYQIRTARIVCASVVIVTLLQLWATGIFSISAFGYSISPDRSVLSWIIFALAPPVIIVALCIRSYYYLHVTKGYAYSKNPKGTRLKFERWILAFRTTGADQVGPPLTHILSESMTARRDATHTCFQGVAVGIIGWVSLGVAAITAVTRSDLPSWLRDASLLVPFVLCVFSWVLVRKANLVQWMFLPVPELLRQHLMLVYMYSRTREPSEAFLLADRMLNESVNVCVECYFDPRTGRIAVQESGD